MATTLLPSDFKEFLKLLNANGVDYLLLGGYAVIYYGYMRTTGDMDIWIAVNPSNAERVAETVKQFGFRDGVSAEMFLEEGKIIRMGFPPVRIELLTKVSGIEFSAAYARRVKTTFDGIDVTVINLEDLKANKKASGRPKDLADLSNLP
jgi:predicted nucleotidyltransferase